MPKWWRSKRRRIDELERRVDSLTESIVSVIRAVELLDNRVSTDKVQANNRHATVMGELYRIKGVH